MKPTTPFSVCKEFCAGTDGKSGTTFIPNVSPEGVISWTNDGGLKNPDPVTIKGVTSYNDLTNKPITVLNYEPTNEQLAQMGEGIYLARVEDYTFPDYLYFFSTREVWEYYDNVECKHESWTVTIISHNGIRVERKDNYRAFEDGREEFDIDWREVPLNDNMVTKDYVDSAIGDVETSLENIIEKYGLGGDSV